MYNQQSYITYSLHTIDFEKENEDKTNSLIEKGQPIMVTQTRNMPSRGQCDIIIMATKDKLFSDLLKYQQSDETYIEDFLLTYRTFYSHPFILAKNLFSDFEKCIDMVMYILFNWIQMHFNDFERHETMLQFLVDVEHELDIKIEKTDVIRGYLSKLRELLDKKAQPRSITLYRAISESSLGFSIIRNSNKSIFISDVNKESKAQKAGLKRADEILNVNGQCFKIYNKKKEALDILKSKSDLFLTVKSNLIGYNDTFTSKMEKKKNFNETNENFLISNSTNNFTSTDENITRSLDYELVDAIIDESFKDIIGTSNFNEQRLSSSSPNFNILPNLTTLSSFEEIRVIKIFKADQSFQLIKVDKTTTAKDVVIMSLDNLKQNNTNIIKIPLDYSLVEISIQNVNNSELVVQHTLTDTASNLFNRASLYSRYYLKENWLLENVFPNKSIADLKKEVDYDLLTLETSEIAYQLTCQSLDLFSKIRPSEYIVKLFNMEENAGISTNLENFAQLFKTEMFWVVASICREQNPNQRVKIFKRHIRIAQKCIKCYNFNSAFAIISGLYHQALKPLKYNLTIKYKKLLKDLKVNMNSIQTMQNFRDSILELQPPIIIYYPLANEELESIHIDNKSMVNELINFEKLRLIADKIRWQYRMVLSQDGFVPILDSDNEILNKLKTRIRNRLKLASSSMPKLKIKELYDASQMSKKVSTYLDSREIISNEDQLQESYGNNIIWNALGQPRKSWDGYVSHGSFSSFDAKSGHSSNSRDSCSVNFKEDCSSENATTSI